MYTATAKTILAPIADAISQMMVINLDSETMSTPMPDLTAVAQLVSTQAANLTQIGRSMMEGGDEELQRDMPLACDDGANFLINQSRLIISSEPCGRIAVGIRARFESESAELQGSPEAD
jgi:hypothetical protein